MTMRRIWVALIAVLCSLGAAPALAIDQGSYDQLLARYVVVAPDGVNRVRYRTWHANAQDVAALNDYVTRMQAERPSRLPRAERIAFWVNLYNAITLQIILENYPVRSIRDIPSRTLDPRGLIGPWRTERVVVEGRRLTLDQIEHAILRRDFNEPRIHYAVNCASIGCPNLLPRAWRAETLEADLDAAARAYVNHSRGVSVDDQGRVRGSQIYQWYAADFGGRAGVLTHIHRYAARPLRADLSHATTMSSYGYDWSLNDSE